MKTNLGFTPTLLRNFIKIFDFRFFERVWTAEHLRGYSVIELLGGGTIKV
ncbi:MAG: hypothetical protein R8G66_19240 [Cytophagales bacterium]|nr:hypothetical protein [Cytophagales bacterium]